jgi:hypothetical protein
MRTIAVYPGRFHPFHKGHAASFKQLASAFGLENTFLAISQKQEQPKSPFSAKDRAKMAVILGIPMQNILFVRNTYGGDEYMQQLQGMGVDVNDTALVLGVSGKDMGSDPRFSFSPKKDGSPSYLQSIDSGVESPMTQHAYIMTTDVAPFNIAGMAMTDASQIRSAYAKGDEQLKAKILTDLYGKGSKHVKPIFDKNLALTESIYKKLVLLKQKITESKQLNEFDPDGYEQYTLYTGDPNDQYEVEKFKSIEEAIEEAKFLMDADPSTKSSFWTVQDMDNNIVWSHDPSEAYDLMRRNQKIQFGKGVAEAADKKCPPATQDITLNLKNRQKAIDEYGYGPLNPDMPNNKFWMKKVDEWNLDTVEEAKESLCGNCAAFDVRQDTLDCIASGIDADNPEDAEGVIDAGELGYCKFLKFKCASRRTCDAWVTGGPLTDKQDVSEAGSPAQQAAIAINMKKNHKKPKNVSESQAVKITDYDTWSDEVKELGAEIYPQKDRNVLIAQSWDGEQIGKFHLGKSIGFINQSGELDETIRKMGSQYRLLSKKGKNLGTFPSKSGAEKHEREVQYFKHMSEEDEQFNLEKNNPLNHGIKRLMVRRLARKTGYETSALELASDEELTNLYNEVFPKEDYLDE